MISGISGAMPPQQAPGHQERFARNVERRLDRIGDRVQKGVRHIQKYVDTHPDVSPEEVQKRMDKLTEKVGDRLEHFRGRVHKELFEHKGQQVDVAA